MAIKNSTSLAIAVAVLLNIATSSYIWKTGERATDSPPSMITFASYSMPPPAAICSANTPCGWAVYDKFSRILNNYAKNTCECPSTMECIKDEEDVSISAYVFRCYRVTK